MKNKMDILFAPEVDEAPKIIISIKKFNHVYLGLYKGFDKKTAKEVTRYFWAEHDHRDMFFRCMVSEDMKYFTLDAIANNLIKPFSVSTLQKEVFNSLKEHTNCFVNESGKLAKIYKEAIINGQSPFMIFRDSDVEQEFTIAELHIIDTLNRTWFLDATIQFA